MRNRKGFTLIELLVVISIIGILMSLLLVAYQGTRKSARDGKRQTELENIRSALEIYYTDCGEYPATASLSFGGSLKGTKSSGGVCLTSDTYMAAVPKDSLDPTYQYRYNRASTSSYYLCAYLENGSGSVANCGGNCGTPTVACNYQVTQP